MAKWVSRTWQSLVERPALAPGSVPVERLLFPFASLTDIQKYTVTTDRVMGGETVAAFSLRPFRTFSAGCFEGIVKFEESEEFPNGGFANVRTDPAHRERLEPDGDDGVSLAAYEALAMRVKTDGRVYRLNLHSSDHGPDDVYQMEFTTAPGRWDTLILPFASFQLVSRGRLRPEGYELDPRRVDGMGILLADRTEGPFKLEVQWVKAIERYNAAAARRSAGAEGHWAARAAHSPAGGAVLSTRGVPGQLPALPSLAAMPPLEGAQAAAPSTALHQGHADAQDPQAHIGLGVVTSPSTTAVAAKSGAVSGAEEPLQFPAALAQQAADAALLPGFKGVAAKRAAMAARLEALAPGQRKGLTTAQRKNLARADGEDVLSPGD